MEETFITYLIIAIILAVIVGVIFKINHKDFNIEANKLMTYLGGKDNIINAECNMSRFKVILKDISKVDKNGIQKLGAKGIVEVDNQLKIVFGKDARTLKKYIDQIV